MAIRRKKPFCSYDRRSKMLHHNNIDTFITELALYCDGNNQKFFDLSNLFIDVLTSESSVGIKNLRPQRQIEKLVMQLHMAGSSIKSVSRENFFQTLLANTENLWLIDKLFGQHGVEFSP